MRAAVPGASAAVDPLAPRYRAMADEVALATYRANRTMYDRLLTKTPSAKWASRASGTVSA